MARYAPAALVAALLVATGAAFLHAESLKLETSPIRQTRVTKLFSPVCRCATSKARIAFRLANPDVVSVSVIDDAGRDVRRLVTQKPAAGRVAVLWNGRDESGRVVADGAYRARVRLDLVEKAFTLPNPIEVDTRLPIVEVVSVEPRVFSPDDDRRADRVTVSYAINERAQAMLYVDKVRRVVEAGTKPAGELRWFGKIGGRSLPARRYGLTVVVVDRAGNRSAPAPAGPVRIRYIEVVPARLTVRTGGWIRIRVLTDARQVTWRLRQRSGVARPPVFRIRAPRAAGRYAVVVGASGHHARVTVIVTEP